MAADADTTVQSDALSGTEARGRDRGPDSSRGLAGALAQGLRELFSAQRREAGELQDKHADTAIAFLMGRMGILNQLEQDLARLRADNYKLRLGGDKRQGLENLQTLRRPSFEKKDLSPTASVNPELGCRGFGTERQQPSGWLELLDIDAVTASAPVWAAGQRQEGGAPPKPPKGIRQSVNAAPASALGTPRGSPKASALPGQLPIAASVAATFTSVSPQATAQVTVSPCPSPGPSSDDAFMPVEINTGPKPISRSHSGESIFSNPTEVFEVLPMWQPNAMRTKNSAMRLLKKRGMASLEEADTKCLSEFMPEETETKRSCWSHLTIHPSSAKRGAWDLCSFVLVLYDCVVIPLQFFDPPESAFLNMMTWLCRCFWTIDIVLSFFTGFVRADGSPEMNFKGIAWRYARSWLVLDVGIVLTDWLELIWSQSSNLGYTRVGKVSRAFRILRMVRLLRFIRVREVLKVIFERIRSERLLIIAHMGQLILAIIAWSHLIACIWYGIGSRSEPSRSWVRGFFRQSDNLGYRYSSSLHWSLSHLTGGMDEIRPHNVEERVFSVAMFIIAFILAAAFISHLTSSMTQLHILTSRQVTQVAALRRFLAENGISEYLANRVQRNALHAVSESERFISEDSVELLSHVSGPLRIELHFAMYSPIFAEHPFFSLYTEKCPEVMRKVCHTAAINSIFHDGDVIFSPGEIPLHPKMYFVCGGSLRYVSLGGEEKEVQIGDWLSEPALWVEWMHRGELRVISSSCRLCMLDAQQFQQIASQFQHIDFDPRDYALKFVDAMTNHNGLVTDLSLKVSPVDPEEDWKLSRFTRMSSQLDLVPQMAPVRRFSTLLTSAVRGGGALSPAA